MIVAVCTRDRMHRLIKYSGPALSIVSSTAVKSYEVCFESEWMRPYSIVNVFTFLAYNSVDKSGGV